MSSTNNQKILEHVKSLAFNRSASTTGEIRAINYIKSELEKENIDSKIEHFSFTGYRRVIMRILYTLLICYLLLFRLFLILISYYIIRNLFEVTRRFSLIKKEESKNLYTIISAKKKSTLNRQLYFPLIMILLLQYYLIIYKISFFSFLKQLSYPI